jgi:hypothetical protein
LEHPALAARHPEREGERHARLGKQTAMTKRMAWWAGLALAAAVLYFWGSRAVQPVGTDSGQIRGAIVDAADALQQGRAGDAMRIISPDYKDSTGMNYARLRLLARQAALNRDMWSATVQNVQPRVNGGEADVEVTVVVRPADGGATTDTMRVHMRKERVHAWLVIPTTRWRVTSVDHLPGGLSLLDG